MAVLPREARAIGAAPDPRHRRKPPRNDPTGRPPKRIRQSPWTAAQYSPVSNVALSQRLYSDTRSHCACLIPWKNARKLPQSTARHRKGAEANRHPLPNRSRVGSRPTGDLSCRQYRLPDHCGISRPMRASVRRREHVPRRGLAYSRETAVPTASCQLPRRRTWMCVRSLPGLSRK